MTISAPLIGFVPPIPLDLNAAVVTLSSFDGESSAERLQQAVEYLNGGTQRTVWIDPGTHTMPTTALDPIVSNDVALIGMPGSRLTMPVAAGANGTFFTVGNGVAGSANRVRIEGMQLTCLNTAPDTHAIVLDGVNSVNIDINYASGIAGFVKMGFTAAVARPTLSLGYANYLADRDLNFIHIKRCNSLVLNHVHATSSLGSAVGSAMVVEASDNCDGIYFIGKFEVWSPAGLKHSLVLDSTGGQIVNVKSSGMCVFDSTTDCAVLLKATGGSSRLAMTRFAGVRSTPLSGQVLRMENGSSQVWCDHYFEAQTGIEDETCMIIDSAGDIRNWRIAGVLNYSGTGSPTLTSLMQVGQSYGRIDVSSNRSDTPAAYQHVVETTADVDHLIVDVVDQYASVAAVKHFAYVNGGHHVDVRAAGGGIARPTLRVVEQNEEFFGDVLADEWNVRLGSDAACAGAVTWFDEGMFRMTLGANAAGTMATNGVVLDSGFVGWRPQRGPLSIETKVTLSAVTSVCMFFGFTTGLGLQMPIEMAAGDAVVSTTVHGVGWVFDTAADTDNWWLTGVANNIDAVAQNVGSAPSAATQYVLRIEVGTDGSAYFFKDGVAVGTKMTGACTPTLNYTPIVAAFSREATSKTVDVFWLRCRQVRLSK